MKHFYPYFERSKVVVTATNILNQIGSPRQKNREVGFDPSEDRHLKLCMVLHTLQRLLDKL